MTDGHPIEVRETDHFAYQVYDFFPRDNRGPLGQLSRQDFINLVLQPAKEIIAERFYELPELIPGRTDYRIFHVPTPYVPVVEIYCQLAPGEELVELVELDIDLNPPEHFAEDPDGPTQTR